MSKETHHKVMEILEELRDYRPMRSKENKEKGNEILGRAVDTLWSQNKPRFNFSISDSMVHLVGKEADKSRAQIIGFFLDLSQEYTRQRDQQYMKQFGSRYWQKHEFDLLFPGTALSMHFLLESNAYYANSNKTYDRSRNISVKITLSDDALFYDEDAIDEITAEFMLMGGCVDPVKERQENSIKISKILENVEMI